MVSVLVSRKSGTFYSYPWHAAYAVGFRLLFVCLWCFSSNWIHV